MYQNLLPFPVITAPEEGEAHHLVISQLLLLLLENFCQDTANPRASGVLLGRHRLGTTKQHEHETLHVDSHHQVRQHVEMVQVLDGKFLKQITLFTGINVYFYVPHIERG